MLKIFFFTASLFLSNSAFAVTFEEAFDAYQTRDYKNAASMMMRLAEENRAACYYLGIMYSEGRGVEKNLQTSVAWFKKAAERGYGNAKIRLLYDASKKIPDALDALAFLAEKKDADAMLFLGKIYAEGKGVERNRVEAEKWLKLSAIEGNKIAKKYLNDLDNVFLFLEQVEHETTVTENSEKKQKTEVTTIVASDVFEKIIDEQKTTDEPKEAEQHIKTNLLGFTPLMKALQENASVESIKELLENGEKVDAKSDVGLTPLAIAAEKNTNPEVFKLLVEKGANINYQDEENSTPLIDAAKHNSNPLVIKTLIELGANIEATDKLGNKALFYAKENPSFKDSEILKLLDKK